MGKALVYTRQDHLDDRRAAVDWWLIANIDTSILIKSGEPMKPSQALDCHRAAILAATARFRATNPRVFGSVLLGQDTEGSDLDLLVDTLPGTTLFDLGGLQVELEELLGLRVDLLTPGDLPATFRQHVLSQAQPL